METDVAPRIGEWALVVGVPAESHDGVDGGGGERFESSVDCAQGMHAAATAAYVRCRAPAHVRL